MRVIADLISAISALVTRRLFWCEKMKKTEKIITICSAASISLYMGSRVFLVKFKGRFYPRRPEMCAPPKVCLGWGGRENPSLLQLKLWRMLPFSS